MLLEVFYYNAEAAGFEPANRLRAVNCFRGSLLQPLGHASLNVSFPPTSNFGGCAAISAHTNNDAVGRQHRYQFLDEQI